MFVEMLLFNLILVLHFVVTVLSGKKGGSTVILFGGGYGKKKASKYLKDPPYFIGKLVKSKCIKC